MEKLIGAFLQLLVVIMLEKRMELLSTNADCSVLVNVPVLSQIYILFLNNCDRLLTPAGAAPACPRF
jgi:hypothetical protein